MKGKDSHIFDKIFLRAQLTCPKPSSVGQGEPVVGFFMEVLLALPEWSLSLISWSCIANLIKIVDNKIEQRMVIQ